MTDTRIDEIRERLAEIDKEWGRKTLTDECVAELFQLCYVLLSRIEELERREPPPADYSDEITDEQMQAVLEASKNGPLPALEAAYEFYKDNYDEQ